MVESKQKMSPTVEGKLLSARQGKNKNLVCIMYIPTPKQGTPGFVSTR